MPIEYDDKKLLELEIKRSYNCMKYEMQIMNIEMQNMKNKIEHSQNMIDMYFNQILELKNEDEKYKKD